MNTGCCRSRGLWLGSHLATAPSIFHFHYSDRFFAVVCWFGAALSAAIVAGVIDLVPLWAAMLMWLALWVLYLSIVNVGQRWYGFGWESLLLEAGFLAIFLGNDETAPPLLVLLLARWLVFRVEFGAGLIKLRGDPCWRDLTCLYYHHETQPMPGPLSWFFHHLPKPLHRIEVAGNHFAQLVVPFALFAPQPVASVAAAIVIVTQLWLVLSGNFAWLNWITIILAVSAIDQSSAAAVLPLPEPPPLPGPPAWFAGLVIAVTALMLFLSYWPVRNMISSHQRMNMAFNPYHLGNTYGAFGSIGRIRLEVVIEGTDEPEITEHTVWKEYGFKGKPGDPHRLPRQWAPYHLRLDWLMWFAALSPGYARDWLGPFVIRLLRNDPPTLRSASAQSVRASRRRGMCGLSSISIGSPHGGNCWASVRGGVASWSVTTCHPSRSGRRNRPPLGDSPLNPRCPRATAKCHALSGVSMYRHGRSRQ